MSIAIVPLDSIQRRTKNQQIFDIIDYPFSVSNGKETCIVKVGITGQSHDPAEALGSKKLSQADHVRLAQEWLRSRIEKAGYDPFKRPTTDREIDVPTDVVDYYAEHGEIPHWL
jgi:hypothetical protein